jgi:hypothetical protein
MPFGNFFETLDVVKLRNGKIHISAKGPKQEDEKIRELCVWVFQRSGDDDAAATEMTTVSRESFDQQPESWSLDIGKIEPDEEEPNPREIPFHQGAAIGLAIALIDTPKKNEDGTPVLDTTGAPEMVQKVLLWSQSLDLRDETGSAVPMSSS